MCQTCHKLPASATLHPWEWPGTPWYRLHTDYAGPFEGRIILIIIDAYSKFIDAHVMTSSTSATVVELRQTFATHGLPHVLVSDNGPCFTSDEFAKFCTTNGIKHTRVSPYHSASNGLAERAVQTVKEGLRKTTGDLETRLSRFLAQYRLTPKTTTGQAPSELLMNRRPRSRLDLVQPTLTSRVLDNQSKSMDNHNATAVDRSFYAGEPVWAVNFSGTPKWLPGVIDDDKLGPVTSTVHMTDGRIWKRHHDHLRARHPDESPNMSDPDNNRSYLPPPAEQAVITPIVTSNATPDVISTQTVTPKVIANETSTSNVATSVSTSQPRSIPVVVTSFGTRPSQLVI